MSRADGSTVPFYYILPLGGTDSIRGFTDFRFRDLNAVLFNAEYRWEAFSGMDMALFYDVGSVARRWSDLGSDGWKRSWGIGLRFNTYRSIFMRTELAFGSGEGPGSSSRSEARCGFSGTCDDPRAPLAPVLAGVVIAGSAALVAGPPAKFYRDDPLLADPETQDASHVRPWKVNEVVRFHRELVSRCR